MKKFLAVLGLAVLAANTSAHATGAPVATLNQQDLVNALVASVNPLDLINWKVGDSADYTIKAGAFGNIGTSTKSVTKDDGAALWVTQDMNLMVQKQKVEILIQKADGKVLKTIVNGKEQAPTDDKVEVISQDYTEVTVPAGTFKAIHIVAKTKQVDHIEVWANPRDTVMEGTLKQTMTMQGMDIAMELTKFSHGN